MTTSEVLEAIEKAVERLKAAVASAGDATVPGDGDAPAWTAKDVLAHCIHWAGQIAWGMGAPLQLPPYLAGAAGRRPSADEWNALAAAHYGSLLFDEVQAEFLRVVDALVIQVRRRDDAAMLATDAIPWGGDRPLWQQIGDEAFLHWPEHAEALERVAARTGS